MNRLPTFWRDSSGASAAEFALVVPAFLILIFGTISAVMAVSAVTQMHFAAQRSARCLATTVNAECTKAAIDAYAKGEYNGPALTAFSFSSPTTDPSCGKEVTGTGDYVLVTGFSSTAVRLSATACYPLI